MDNLCDLHCDLLKFTLSFSWIKGKFAILNKLRKKRWYCVPWKTICKKNVHIQPSGNKEKHLLPPFTVRVENSSSSLWSGELLLGINYVSAFIKQSWTSQDTYLMPATQEDVRNTRWLRFIVPQASYNPEGRQLAARITNHRIIQWTNFMLVI